MKNNKGFTLTEVVAVVALLGIIATLVFPNVFRLVDSSKNKIYVQDAIRLIAQAEYTMNAKSNIIEKPESGEVVLFSMNYLSQDDFLNAPNSGSYLTDYSFVLVTKNAEGKYFYSVMLVEETESHTYRGIELCTEDALRDNNSLRLVKNFNADQLLYVGLEPSVPITNSVVLNESKVKNHVVGVNTADSSKWNSFTSITQKYLNPFE